MPLREDIAKYGNLDNSAGYMGQGYTGNPLTNLSLRAALDLFKTLKQIPRKQVSDSIASSLGPSMADIYSSVGKTSWEALKKPGEALAKAEYAGIKKLKGEEADVKKGTVYDVANELPSEFKPRDVVKGLGKLLGTTVTDKQADALLEKTGLDKSLGPIGNLAVASGSINIPDIKPSAITPAVEMGRLPIGFKSADRLTGENVKVGFLDNPVLKSGVMLGNVVADSFRGKKPNATGIPSVSTKTLADYLKQGTAFGQDVITDPTTLIAGAGGIGLKGIRAASKLGPAQGIADLLRMIPNKEITGVGKSGIGKQVFEGFGEFVPRLIGSLIGDEEKVINYFRTPSKIMTPKVFEEVTKARRDISNFGEYIKARVAPWQNIESSEIRKLIGKTLASEVPTKTTKTLGAVTKYGNVYTETGKYDALKESILGIKKNNPELLKQFSDPINQIVEIAKNLRKTATKAGQEAVKAGLLNKKTFLANKDKYVKTFYEFFENPNEYKKVMEASGEVTRLTEKLAGANVPREFGIKKEMFKPLGASFEDAASYANFQKKAGKLGPESIGYAVGEGSMRTYKTSRFGNMYNQISRIKDYSLNDLPQAVKAAMPYQKMVKIGSVDAKTAIVEGKHYIQLPESSKYGAMAKKWIPRADGEYLIGFNKKMGPVEKIVSNAMGMWKTGKVPFSTAAQGRNFLFSNPMQMMFAGVDIIDSFKLSAKRLAMKADGKSDMVTRIVNRYGGGGSTFADAETMKLGSNFLGTAKQGEVSRATKDALNIPGKIYGELENVQKEAMVEWFLNQGVSGKEAYKKTIEALFDYSDKPRFVKDVIKSTAFPFATYSTKALPYVAKTTLQAPMRTLPIISFKDSWNDKQTQKLGLNSKDISNLRDRYGDWFLITGGTKENPNIVDLSYSVPGLPDLFEKQTGRGMLAGSAPQALQPSSPLQAGLEVMPGINKKFYFGSQVYKDTDPKLSELKSVYEMLKKNGVSEGTALKQALAATQGGKIASHLTKTLLPSTPLIPGTYQSEQLVSAVEGKPINSSGDIQSVPGFLGSMIGLKQTPVNMNSLNNRKVVDLKKNIKEISSGILSTNLNKRLNTKEKEISIKVKREQLRKLIEKYNSYNKGQ